MRLLLLLLPAVSFAGKPDVEVGETIVSNETIVGETMVGGNSTRAYAFSHGMGDVDIADCLASTQFGTILFSTQGVKLNRWCAAEIYDAKGLYEMAAKMRCDIKEVSLHFDTEKECIEANTVEAPAPVIPVESNDCDDDCEDNPEVVALQERVAALEAQRQEEHTRRIEVPANQGITDEQRQALAEVFKK